MTQLDLTWDAKGMASFFVLFQWGVRVKARLGLSIREVLCRQLDVTDDYLDNRLNTIFLDGKPVDDTDSALVTEGSVLALSASMPGFAGAALRKGGFYASMRSTITHSAGESPVKAGEGFFTIKLYNMTIPELAPHFLALGVWVAPEALNEFFAGRSKPFLQGGRTVQIDGQEIGVDELTAIRWSDRSDFVRIRVTPKPAPA
jgi:hypothetical protein